MSHFVSPFKRLLISALASFAITPLFAAEVPPSPSPVVAAAQPSEKMEAYEARFGRSRPVVAVVGENSGTVLSDYVIPYGVLSQSGVAEVVSVATQPGQLTLSPLRIVPDSTAAEFDQRYPEGADYVFVPAVMKRDDPTLLAWVAAQAGKGATMISICNGSMVLANAGLTRGHRATGHWSTYGQRVAQYPQTQWLKNTRYVVDGKIVSSAGITAAMPVSLALVEAIAGTERADALAKSLGVGYRGTRHNSDQFHLTLGDGVAVVTNTVFHATQDVGVPVADGVDEIALALTAEAYSATFRSRVHTIGKSAAPIKTRGGLTVMVDNLAGQEPRLDWLLPDWDATPSALALDKALDDISARYGKAAARFVVLEAEYPWPGL